jgi:hypothetical protein
VNSNGTWSRQGQILYYPNLISAGNILMVVNASGPAGAGHIQKQRTPG